MSPTLRNRHSRRWASRGAALAVLGLALTGCSGEAARLGVPEPITAQGERVLDLWQGSWVAAFAVGILVWGLIIWSVIFHRKRSSQLPPQVRYNLPIEALYTVLPIVVIAVLFYFTARDQNYITDTDRDPDVTIDVLAYQWSWQFTYDGEENIEGDDVAVSGVPGPEGSPHMVVPNDSVVHFNLESPDVIHSFWIPAFLFKMDVIPGQPNEFQVDVHVPEEEVENGDAVFEGRCAELCGVEHSQMLFTVEVMSPEDYEAWLEEQKNNPAPLPDIAELEGVVEGEQDDVQQEQDEQEQAEEEAATS
ncbi:aa3-type cytochrome oxidase subunit II [Spiractinospora alimapuensis]